MDLATGARSYTIMNISVLKLVQEMMNWQQELGHTNREYFCLKISSGDDKIATGTRSYKS